MLNEYFKDFDKKIIQITEAAVKKTSKAASKKTAKIPEKGVKKSGVKKPAEKISKKADLKKRKVSFNKARLQEMLERIVPINLSVDSIRPVDSSGFSPDGADLIVYKKYCEDIVKIMGGFIPYELVYGSYHIVPELDKKSLGDVIQRVSVVKHLNKFSQPIDETSKLNIPGFVLVGETGYSIQDLKSEIINYYIGKSIGGEDELDILVIMNSGIIVKNWREKRSYIGLETGGDTMYWFFILMNEYLDVERNIELDFRKYIKKQVPYNEY